MKTVKITNGYTIRDALTFNGTYNVTHTNRKMYKPATSESPAIIRVFLDFDGKAKSILVKEGDYQYFDENGSAIEVRPVKDTFNNSEVNKSAPMTVAEEPTQIENVVQIKREFVPEVHEIEVPEVSPTFIPGTNFKTVSSIVKSNMFMPILITGPSGNGKTIMAQQACAKAKRKMIRVQISPETDEDALIGGMRLIDGNTVFENGPVINAMLQGAVLLIDEIDRGSNKIMCLQGIMEGNDFVIKRTGTIIKPAPGFTIIATGNTKGDGSDDGSFSAATVIDDAFLERFSGVIDQGWPTITQEKRIVEKHCEEYDITLDSSNELLVKRLTRWAKTLRSSYDQGGIQHVISTRRLTHILKTYSILGNLKLAMDMACSKFDTDTKEAMLAAFDLITGNEEEDDDDII